MNIPSGYLSIVEQGFKGQLHGQVSPAARPDNSAHFCFCAHTLSYSSFSLISAAHFSSET